MSRKHEQWQTIHGQKHAKGFHRRLSAKKNWRTTEPEQKPATNNEGAVNRTLVISKDTYLTLRLLMSYTGCPRRNVPDFGRVFLMLKYTDITQNTYVQS